MTVKMYVYILFPLKNLKKSSKYFDKSTVSYTEKDLLQSYKTYYFVIN